MTSHATLSPRVTACAGIVLALVAALGVAVPRSRVSARERVGRAAAIRLASSRINDRLGWVAPDDVAPLAAVDAQPRRAPSVVVAVDHSTPTTDDPAAAVVGDTAAIGRPVGTATAQLRSTTAPAASSPLLAASAGRAPPRA